MKEKKVCLRNIWQKSYVRCNFFFLFAKKGNVLCGFTCFIAFLWLSRCYSITQLSKRNPIPRVKIRLALGPTALKIWEGPTKCWEQGEWPLKMLAYFNIWCKKILEKKNVTPKNLKAFNFLYQEPKWPVTILAYFDLWPNPLSNFLDYNMSVNYIP